MNTNLTEHMRSIQYFSVHLCSVRFLYVLIRSVTFCSVYLYSVRFQCVLIHFNPVCSVHPCSVRLLFVLISSVTFYQFVTIITAITSLKPIIHSRIPYYILTLHDQIFLNQSFSLFLEGSTSGTHLVMRGCVLQPNPRTYTYTQAHTHTLLHPSKKQKTTVYPPRCTCL